MIPQAKLLRVFKLIRLLNQQPGHTIRHLAESLDLSERSVYRYIAFLDTVGYAVDSDPRTGQYYLFGFDSPQPGTFTEEESDLIRQALTGVADTNPLLGSIRQKLFLSSTLVPLADGLVDLHRSQMVSQLVDAIRNRVQVRLIRYHSPNSHTISDRLVEPLELTDNLASLEAYEPASATPKTFKIRRIEAVEVTGVPSTRLTTDAVNDLFNWSGPRWLPVTLHLTDRAYRLLIEEYPATKPDTFERPEHAVFRYGWHGRVRDWRGIGRFVLGLPGEIVIIEGADFQQYLKNRIAEFTS